MKKLLIGITFLVLVAVAGVALVSSSQAAATAAPKPQTSLPIVKADAKIVAEAKVVPATSAELAFTSGGIIAEVPVAHGEQVKAGKLLARLDTRILELQVVQEEANLAAAQARLGQLKNTPSAAEVDAAKQRVAAAQAGYDNLLHPSAGELATLKTDVEKSKARLDQATAAYDRLGGDSNPYAGMLPQRADVQTAWFDFIRSQALYDARINPPDDDVQNALAEVQDAKNHQASLAPTADELAEAQANVASARAARDLAAERITNAKILAPFAGMIISSDAKVGEYVMSGTSVLKIADISVWQIETTDLTELDVVKIREAMPVTITFDAIPGFELPGKVSLIKYFGENRQGDIVYTVVVTPDQQDTRLRWNMSAKVNIDEAW
ncbi:MAG: HlyD family secretion protein [Acidobacteriota bacterium]